MNPYNVNSGNGNHNVKSVGPFRYQSSGCSIPQMQFGGDFGLTTTITVTPPFNWPVSKSEEKLLKSSRQENFNLLREKHRKALSLLAE